MQTHTLIEENGGTLPLANHSAAEQAGRTAWWAGLGGLILLVIGLSLAGPFPVAWLEDYLVHFMFLTTIILGALCFVCLQHLSRAGWSVTVRRTAEFMASMPSLSLIILFLPLAASLFAEQITLYPWARGDYFTHLPHLSHKAIYLNIPFFLIRAAFCLGVWWWLGQLYLRGSLRQDQDGNPAWTILREKWSPLAALLLAVTLTVASFDWLMSLTPAWYSTIYGIYIFSGCAVGGLAGLILILLLARRLGLLSPQVVTMEHLHDLGKLLFGFVIFWGYIAFSQYLLIWYGNMPEESQFYWPRQKGGWLFVSLALIFGHLLIPLVGMMSRAVKRNTWTLGFFATWLLLFHWLDLYWLVKPNTSPDLAWGQLLGGLIGAVGTFGILTGLVLRGFARYSSIPLRDPRLAEALHHEVT